MKNGTQKRSLLPYLNHPSSDSYLKISLLTEETASAEGAPFAFLWVTDSDPLTHIVKADFLGEAESEFKRVFLLLQNDRYTLPKNVWWPLDNKQVEGAWKKAFAFYSQETRGHSVIALGNQVDHAGQLVPLRSLFFCTPKQMFFEPPCPFCGRLLEQCDNDDLLGENGLPAYSTSLRRYLFCPLCIGSGRECFFYAYERERSEPARVKDWRGLVEDFAALIQKGDSLEGFPCTQCSDRTACYAAKGTVISKIVPFAFYPFFMMIFEHMPVNGLDFLGLVSGASIARQPDHAYEEETVYEILTGIIEKWKRDARTGDVLVEKARTLSEHTSQEKGEPPREEEEAVLRETVILSPEGPPDEKAPRPGEHEEMVLEETVVVSPAREPAEEPPLGQAADEEAIPETVVIAPRKGPARPADKGSETALPGVQRQTLGESGRIPAGSDGEEVSQKKGKKDEDVLPETVLISPIERKKHGGDEKT